VHVTLSLSNESFHLPPRLDSIGLGVSYLHKHFQNFQLRDLIKLALTKLNENSYHNLNVKNINSEDTSYSRFNVVCHLADFSYASLTYL